MTTKDQRRSVSAEVQRTALNILLRHGVVSADDVRQVLAIPDGIDPRIVGPAFLALKNDGLIEEIGDHRTGRAVAHRRTIRDWRLKGDRRATEVMLAKLSPVCVAVRKERTLLDALDEPLRETNAGESVAADSPAVDTHINPQAIGEKDYGSTV
jgi:hypothetical protein